MFNKVVLVGRVAVEPELRYTPSGKPVANFVIAVDRFRSSSQEERNADFITIVTWQKLAEICANYLNKGKLILIEGRLQTRSYQTNEGAKRKVYEVVANNMKMLDRPKTTGAVVEAVETETESPQPIDIETTTTGSEESVKEEAPF